MASTAVQTDGHRPPDLSSADRQALQDLWKVYGAQYDEITEESKAALANDPEFGPLMQSIPEEMLEQQGRSEEHTSELQSLAYLVCRLLLEKKKKKEY